MSGDQERPRSYARVESTVTPSRPMHRRLGRRLPSCPTLLPQTATLHHYQFICEHTSSMDATCCRTDCMQPVFRPQTPPHVILANSVPTKMSLRKREHHQLTLTCTKTLLLNSTISWCPYVIEIHDIFISTRRLAANQNAMARTCFGARSTYVTA